MALTVEDGTGKNNSESYASAAFATTYHAGRANAAWALADPTTVQEPALRRATDFMIQTFRGRWKGRRVLVAQALDWPRVGVVLEDFGASPGRNGYGSYGLFQVSYQIVPDEVMRACCELALRALTAALNPDIDPFVASESVGPVSVTYSPGQRRQVKIQSIEDLLAPFLELADGNLRISRA